MRLWNDEWRKVLETAIKLLMQNNNSEKVSIRAFSFEKYTFNLVFISKKSVQICY